MENLEGRVAIITGASRGIGKAIALKLAEAGCDIVVAAKTAEPHPKLPGTIHDTAREVEALGRRALPVQCNVREEGQIQNLAARTRETFGRIDILINNAGALWWFPVRDTPAKRFDLVMDINARAAFLCAHECLPAMTENGWGHIVNMSPPIDLRAVPGRVAYMISKFGMTMLSHGLAEEVRGDNIAVNSLWPVTGIESLATINFGLLEAKYWRKADIMADATLAIVSKAPGERTGQALLDEDALRADGVTDFRKYRYDPDTEPLRIEYGSWNLGSGVGGSGKGA